MKNLINLGEIKKSQFSTKPLFQYMSVLREQTLLSRKELIFCVNLTQYIGLACCNSWGRKELETTERLN